MSAKIRIFDENGDEQPFSKFRMKEELKGHGNPTDLIVWALARTGFLRADDLSFGEDELRTMCEEMDRVKNKLYGQRNDI